MENKPKVRKKITMAHRDITAGQRFRCLEPIRADWEVTYVYSVRPGVSHAVVVRLDDATTTKTLACSVLLDAQRYRLIPQD